MSDFEKVKRQTDERFMDYQLRIGRNRELYGLSWTEVSVLLNSQPEVEDEYTESKWRKDIQAYLRVYDLLLEKNVGLKELQEEKDEFYKTKVQTQDQLREKRKLLRVEGRVEHLEKLLISSIEKLNGTSPLRWYKHEVYSNDRNKESILMNSDWHKGLFAANYWNTYNDDEFYKRLNYLTNRSIEYNKNHHVKTVHIMNLGDLIHGSLHRLTRLIDTEDAISATQSVSEALAGLISLYANEFEQVKVYNVRGNHDRMSSRKDEEIAKESLNDLVPWYLKTRLSNFKNVEFIKNTYDDEIIVADVAGHKVFATHGHRDKLNSIVQDLTMMVGQKPNYVLSGHIHHSYENEIHSVEHIVNSSFAGVDDYAKEIRKTSKPAQKLLIFDKGIGRECTYNIRLDL